MRQIPNAQSMREKNCAFSVDNSSITAKDLQLSPFVVIGSTRPPLARIGFVRFRKQSRGCSARSLPHHEASNRRQRARFGFSSNASSLSAQFNAERPRFPTKLSFANPLSSTTMLNDAEAFPTSRSILLGQVTLEGTIIGCRQEKESTMKSVIHRASGNKRNNYPGLVAQNVAVVLVAHDGRRSVARSIQRVIRAEFTPIVFAPTGHIGLFRDGVLVCSTRNSGGCKLTARLAGQRHDFLLRAPAHVFTPESLAAPSPPPRKS